MKPEGGTQMSAALRLFLGAVLLTGEGVRSF